MSRQTSDFLFGFLLVILLHIFIFIILFLFSSYSSQITNIALYAFFGIGISQILYVAPTIIFLVRRQDWQIMKGVILGAVVTALANAGCWIILPR